MLLCLRNYRRDIIDGILKDESKIEPSQLPSLKSMYTADQAITSELLDKLLSDKRITQAVIKKIKDVNK